MCAYYGQVVFHGGYNNNKNFYLWDIWQNKAAVIGCFKGYLKGLENGRFISIEKNGFKIISPFDE